LNVSNVLVNFNSVNDEECVMAEKKTDFKKNPKADFKDLDEMSKEEAHREIEALREGINYHDYLYYARNKPEISDALYDKLFRRLEELEKAFPEFHSETSPTQRVGAAPVSKLRKVEHTAPMLSLNAALEQKEVKNFCDFVQRNTKAKKIRYVLEPKFDGFSVELVYEEGRFKYGATRGDGEVGEDISRNLMTIGTVPLSLQGEKVPSLVSVRGEVFMPKEGFQQLNRERIEKGEEPFANPRNAAAGTMRQLDPKNVSDKPLDILVYDILQVQGNGFSTHWDALRQFPKWGFKTDNHNKRCSSFDEIKEYHKKLSEKRDDVEYEIDGIVIKLDDFDLRKALGTRQRSPRWAFAWKFPPKEEITKLEEIVVQVGRTGILTPVALLQPVDVGGVTVSRATLHNEDEVRKKDVRSGDTVRIARAGDVIPEVVERVKKPGQERKEEFSMPRTCPACGAKVYREGAYYFCAAGLTCPPQITGRIIHYASRDAMDIAGLGDKTAADMVEKGLVKDIADLYKLSVEDILKLDGFAQKSAGQLHEAIQGTKHPRLDRFLYALGIRHVGQHVARVLAQEYRSLEALQKAGREDIEKTTEIGPEISRSVAHFFKQKENRSVLERLAKAGVKVNNMPAGKKATPLEGTTFVFTGKLEGHTRQEAENVVEDLGGRAASSVSKETDFVVAGKDPGRKYDDAKELGVKIIDEKEFEQQLRS
jgi:DNA ligase (NAD+)